MSELTTPPAGGDGPPAASWVAPLLEGWANGIAARFSAPVYLVGSALNQKHPRDIDVRVVITDDAFKQRYGCSWIETESLGPGTSPEVANYWRDVAKLGKWASETHAGGTTFNVDFQVHAESGTRRNADKPRVRLDKLGDFEPVSPPPSPAGEWSEAEKDRVWRLASELDARRHISERAQLALTRVFNDLLVEWITADRAAQVARHGAEVAELAADRDSWKAATDLGREALQCSVDSFNDLNEQATQAAARHAGEVAGLRAERDAMRLTAEASARAVEAAHALLHEAGINEEAALASRDAAVAEVGKLTKLTDDQDTAERALLQERAAAVVNLATSIDLSNTLMAERDAAIANLKRDRTDFHAEWRQLEAERDALCAENDRLMREVEERAKVENGLRSDLRVCSSVCESHILDAASLRQNIRVEMEGVLKLRQELGARDDESFPDFVRRLAREAGKPADLTAPPDLIRRLEQEAANKEIPVDMLATPLPTSKPSDVPGCTCVNLPSNVPHYVTCPVSADYKPPAAPTIVTKAADGTIAEDARRMLHSLMRAHGGFLGVWREPFIAWLKEAWGDVMFGMVNDNACVMQVIRKMPDADGARPSFVLVV